MPLNFLRLRFQSRLWRCSPACACAWPVRPVGSIHDLLAVELLGDPVRVPSKLALPIRASYSYSEAQALCNTGRRRRRRRVLRSPPPCGSRGPIREQAHARCAQREQLALQFQISREPEPGTTYDVRRNSSTRNCQFTGYWISTSDISCFGCIGCWILSADFQTWL
jgi:hypothetical protein